VFLDKLSAHIKERGLTAPGETICVAASGGPDSTALLFALSKLKDELRINLLVCHINHGLRGADSDGDMEFVQNLAKRLSIPCILRGIHLERYQKAVGGSLQSVARALRYMIFDRIISAKLAHKIATAHTLDDNAETVLLNLIRGAGPAGMAGIPISRESKFIRPLLSQTKNELLDYLQSNAVEFRVDSSNNTDKYARNRIRNLLIPFLKSDFNPSITSALSNSAQIMTDVQNYMSIKGQEVFDSITKKYGNAGFMMERTEVNALHPAMQREVIRIAIARSAKGTLTDVSFEHVEEIRRLISTSMGGEKIINGNLSINVAHGTAYFRTLDADKPPPFSYQFITKGELNMKEVSCSLVVEPISAPPASFDTKCKTVYIDANSIPADAIFRTRRDGDKFQPLGAGGSMKLKKFMIEKKIPRWERDLMPILATGFEALWVPGFAISEKVKLSSKTERILKMCLKRVSCDI
jgi:tRNA(Ile)-lysidine synthase